MPDVQIEACDPNWELVLKDLNKGDSFCVTSEENILNIYTTAEAMCIGIRHQKISKDQVKIWRVN